MDSLNLYDLQYKIIQCYNKQHGKGAESLLRALRTHPDSKNNKKLAKNLAYCAGKVKDPIERLRLFKQVISLDSKNIKLLTSYASALVKAKKIEEALPIFEKILGDFPDDYIALTAYGSALIRNNNFTKALIVLQKALEIKRDVILLSNYAKALLKNGKIVQSCQTYQEIIQLQPDNRHALTGYAKALLEKGDISKALEKFAEALELKSNDIITLNNYAAALMKQGQVEKAFDYFELSLKIESGNSISLSSYAIALAEYGRTEKACGYFERSLEIEPNNPITLTNYATTLAKRGQMEEACAYFEHSLEIEPNNPITLTSYATTLTKCGQSEKAFVCFDFSLKIQPDNVIALTSYATALVEYGQLEKAFSFFESSLKIEPDNSITLTSFANALIQEGLFSQAFEKLDRAHFQDPKNPIILATYGVALASYGETQKALKKFNQALALDPHNILTLTNYGKALAQAGEYELALTIFEKVIQQATDDPVALFLAANTLQVLKQPEKAVEKLEKIRLDNLTPDKRNFFLLNMGRLYIQIGRENEGQKYLDIFINNSNNADMARLRAARHLLLTKPYSEEANRLLQEIAESSRHYTQARRMLSLNLNSKDHFEAFGKYSAGRIQDTAQLNRALYHKIKNIIAVLKEIIYEKLTENDDPLLRTLTQKIDDIFTGIKSRRAEESATVNNIYNKDYIAVLRAVSDTAHKIVDFVGNKVGEIREGIWEQKVDLLPDDPRQVLYQEILQNLQHTLAALNDLKAVNEGIRIKKSTFPLVAIFETWLSTSTLRHARITVSLAEPDRQIVSDLQKLKGFIDELIENSLKHNPGKTGLIIWLTAEIREGLPLKNDRKVTRIPGQNHYLYLCVYDNGKGIPENKKDWIFQPLATTSIGDEGSGLGLFGIRRTVEEMRGFVQETGSNGARFEIYIPLEET